MSAMQFNTYKSENIDTIFSQNVLNSVMIISDFLN